MYVFMEQIESYIATLNHFEKHAMEIAKQHLGSSFDLSKSNGFMKWLNAAADDGC